MINTQNTLRIHPHPKTSLRAAAEFTDVTLVKKDDQPPTAHSIILRAVRPYLRKFDNENYHPHSLIYLGFFLASHTNMCI